MNISVQQVYTSVACNRTPEIVDWNGDGLICFGASNAVVIYDTKEKHKDPLTVLTHHKSHVNSVKWLRKPDHSSTELLSCSADKTAAIWSQVDGIWKVTSTLAGHTEGVSCIYGIYIGNELIVYTGSIDSTVRVWKRINGETSHIQTICLQSGLCLSLHAHILPTVNKPILFCALDDHKIHIFSGEEYHRVHTLVGHEDWVRGLDVLDADDTTILVASASQDTYIRIWRIEVHTEEPTDRIKVEEKLFTSYGCQWAVKLDAVLAGHEGWVYGVQWQPCDGTIKKPVHRLLSSSLDKTLIIWEPEWSPTRGQGEGDGGAWVERVRVGEVGGNGLGFYGSRFGPNGKEFLGHGYNGSFHIWRLCEETNEWVRRPVPGGHFSSVEELMWEPRARGPGGAGGPARYLVTVSADQTTRIHAPWKKPDGSTEWHELARPQVHGYDMSSIALISSIVFASSAEEKVIRVFKAPHNFVQNFESIVGEKLVEGDDGGPEGASVPSLGLSNKAVFNDEDSSNGNDNDGYFVPIHLTEPGTEESLMQNTLWPETHKLYGHGYEVFTLAASPDGTLLASACKATVADHAALIIWETKNWQQIQKLVSHQLTVTQIAFSPDSQRLLSVSRDRKWTLYQRRENSNSFDIIACTDKTNGVHSRIIWCCAWAHDGNMFSTGSRDGKVCLWSKTQVQSQSSLGEYSLLGQPLEVKNESITAVAFAPLLVENARIIAVGFETGIIRIYRFVVGGGWNLLRELDKSAAHHMTVKRLAFRPNEDDNKQVLLASCGSDHLVRIHSVNIS